VSTLPLSGIRVIDLTRILAGPFCSMLLADMGAEVIKVEPRDGDPIRGHGHFVNGISTYFAQFNRNKRSIVLDLYSDDGKAVLSDLIRGADVLLENYRPGILAKMGFGQERLDELNPNLVLGSINGYGSDGPYVDRPAFDFIAQAMSGFMSTNGPAESPPLRSGAPVGDLIAGLYAAFGIASALAGRGKTAGGRRVEATLMGGLTSMLAFLSAEYFATGKLPARTGNDHPVVCPYGLFRAKDGDVAIAPAGEPFVSRLFKVLDLMPVLDDPDFADNAGRMRNRARMNALVDEKIGANTVDHWIEVLNAAGVPCGRVQDIEQVVNDPQLRSQGLVLSVDHPGHGEIGMFGCPVRLDGQAGPVRLPAPELGADTKSVLSELGYDAGRIAELQENRTIL
jgi:CoA:oxalate CoA-transferase